MVGDTGPMPRSGRSPGGGNGNPFQVRKISWREDPGGLTVHGVTKSLTRLSMVTHHCRVVFCLEYHNHQISCS